MKNMEIMTDLWVNMTGWAVKKTRGEWMVEDDFGNIHDLNNVSDSPDSATPVFPLIWLIQKTL